MVSVFNYEDYRAYLQDYLGQMPKKGYGQLKKLADFVGVHTTLISQIFKGSKNLTTDQAVLVAEFFGLNEKETEYFVGLLNLNRAGNESSRRFARGQIQKMKRAASNVNARLAAERKVTVEEQAYFYSSWVYSAVRQMTAIPGYQDPETIANRLGLTMRKVRQVLEFLVRTGLCREVDGQFAVGPASTALDSASPWSRVHRVNWRERAISSLDKDEENNFFYSLPMTLSESDVRRIKECLLKLLEELGPIVDASPSETLYCLNLDWFKV